MEPSLTRVAQQHGFPKIIPASIIGVIPCIKQVLVEVTVTKQGPPQWRPARARFPFECEAFTNILFKLQRGKLPPASSTCITACYSFIQCLLPSHGPHIRFLLATVQLSVVDPRSLLSWRRVRLSDTRSMRWGGRLVHKERRRLTASLFSRSHGNTNLEGNELPAESGSESVLTAKMIKAENSELPGDTLAFPLVFCTYFRKTLGIPGNPHAKQIFYEIPFYFIKIFSRNHFRIPI